MNLPKIQSLDPVMNLLQSKWKSIIDPILSNPSNQSSLLNGVLLSNGTTTVNHLLGRKLQGWRVVGINAAATVYDAQATNPRPELTLILISNAAATVNLEVF